MRSQVLLIGGRSGVGKTTAALALHELLSASDVRHAVIEGDYLDLAHPTPHLEFPEANLAERNLRAVWANYRELGYRRLIYTNTASVLFADALAAAMGDDPEVTAVLLRADEPTVLNRLTGRGQRYVPRSDLDRSGTAAALLDGRAPVTVHRIDTETLTSIGVAAVLARLTGWASESAEGSCRVPDGL